MAVRDARPVLQFSACMRIRATPLSCSCPGQAGTTGNCRSSVGKSAVLQSTLMLYIVQIEQAMSGHPPSHVLLGPVLGPHTYTAWILHA